jgi:hypothetical protein
MKFPFQDFWSRLIVKFGESSSPGEFHPQGRVEGATQWVPLPPQNVACRFPALRSSEFDSQLFAAIPSNPVAMTEFPLTLN